MSVLSEDTQQSVQDSLVKDGVITAEQLAEAKQKSDKEQTPIN
ncbi:MAG: hypothetical protein WDN66_01965 [Candidatus Saccharibacteria bacterium]